MTRMQLVWKCAQIICQLTSCHTILILWTMAYQSLIASRNGILLPELFWPTLRKKCSSDREKLLEFKAEGQEFSKCLRSLEQFIQTVKGQNNFW